MEWGMYQAAVLALIRRLQFLQLMSTSLITVVKILNVTNGSSSFCWSIIVLFKRSRLEDGVETSLRLKWKSNKNFLV